MFEWDQDVDLGEMKADRVIKGKNRMTCIAINNLNEYYIKPKSLLGKRKADELESDENDESQSSSDQSE